MWPPKVAEIRGKEVVKRDITNDGNFCTLLYEIGICRPTKGPYQVGGFFLSTGLVGFQVTRLKSISKSSTSTVESSKIVPSTTTAIAATT
jgi:hypothetical protein